MAPFRMICFLILFIWLLSLGELSCGRGCDLQWIDESKLLVSSALSNTPPEKRTLQPTPLLITPSDLKSNHLSLYIYNLSVLKIRGTESEACENEVVDNTDKCRSVTTALMQKANHYPSVKIDSSGKNNTQQDNTLVEFVKSNKYGVRGVSLSEYINVVQKFADVLWEIDPNYHKLLTRNYSFPEIVTKQFLGFNDPKNMDMPQNRPISVHSRLKFRPISVHSRLKFRSISVHSRLKFRSISVHPISVRPISVHSRLKFRSISVHSRLKFRSISVHSRLKFRPISVHSRLKLQRCCLCVIDNS